MKTVTTVQLDVAERSKVLRDAVALSGLADDWRADNGKTAEQVLAALTTRALFSREHYGRALEAACLIRDRLAEQTAAEFWEHLPHIDGFVEMRRRDVDRITEVIEILAEAFGLADSTPVREDRHECC